jgi:hypothetical protein
MDTIRITSTLHPHKEKPGAITVSNLSKEETERFVGLIHGQNWASVKDGRLVFQGIFSPLPDPVLDEEMLPFWFPQGSGAYTAQKEVFDKERMAFPSGAHIAIQSLCAYDYTPKNYKKEAGKLESYGFSQMRSKRGKDGHFWEIWFLPGTWAAKGDLAEAIQLADLKARGKGLEHTKKEKACLDAAIDFLRRNVKFGSLEVAVQRLAMVIDD